MQYYLILKGNPIMFPTLDPTGKFLVTTKGPEFVGYITNSPLDEQIANLRDALLQRGCNAEYIDYIQHNGIPFKN